MVIHSFPANPCLDWSGYDCDTILYALSIGIEEYPEGKRTLRMLPMNSPSMFAYCVPYRSDI